MSRSSTEKPELISTASEGVNVTVPSENNERHLSGFKLFTLVTALLLSVFLVALDESVLATAIPRIVSQFDGLSEVGWIGSAYFLTEAAFFLPFGQYLAVAPTKYNYLAAVFLFELGSLLCGVSMSMEFLIFGRAVAGCGAAGIFTSVLSIIAEVAPLERRPLLFGLISGIFGAAAIAGPLIGGALTDHLTWRWCFFINLPVGAVSLAAIIFILKVRAPAEQSIYSGKSTVQKWISLDWVGIVLVLGMSTSLLLPLQWGGNTKSWDDATVIACFCLTGFLIAVFVWWETKQGDYALLVLRKIKRPTFIGGALAAFFTFSAQMLGVYYIPLWYQAAKGFSATKAGLSVIPFLLSVVLASALSGAIINRTGRYWIWLCLPPIFTAVGAGLLYAINPGISAAKLIGYQILFGIGVGAPLQNVFVAIQAELKDEPAMIPQANSFVSFAQLFGAIISIAIAGTIFGNKLSENIAKYVPDLPPEFAAKARDSVSVVSELEPHLQARVRDAYSRSLTPTYLIAIPCAGFAILCSFLIKNQNLKKISKPAGV